MYSLFGLTVFCPAGKLLTACFGYTFRLTYVFAFACALATLSLLTIYLDKDEKEPMGVVDILLTIILIIVILIVLYYILFLFVLNASYPTFMDALFALKNPQNVINAILTH